MIHRIAFGVRRRWRTFMAVQPLAAVALLPHECTTKPPPAEEPAPVIASASVRVPPVAFTGEPVGTFVDAAVPDGKTPYEQALAYQANGQHWLARLVLEKKALGADGTRQERELLAWLCHEQEDEACVDECSRRLGKKLKFDGGAPRQRVTAGEHKEPQSDLARARDAVLKRRFDEARSILEPKVIDGKASKEEIRLLKVACKEEGDRMCTALCDAKMK